ncbi:MAG TPA: magnesium transporter CorA family protein [Geminicoccaceae bacterium]|nr:magnesium transporter CorA family protein [Geminicoccaceae bacterium]
MLRVYTAADGVLRRAEPPAGDPIPEEAVWLDMLEPSAEEELAVEAALGIDIPTREEMREIEISSRLYEEDGALYLTAQVVAHADTDAPESTAITFVLTRSRLVTVRYADPKPFQSFATHAERHPSACATGEAAFAGLFEAIIDRSADILEAIGADMDAISRDVFAQGEAAKGRDFQALLARIGRNGDLASKVRESLVSIGRLLSFSRQVLRTQPERNIHPRLEAISHDITSLGDYAAFLSNKINFMLDATLGMINIQQTDIIKIFSIAAAVFLPPTLIASIYGMNFTFMPELHWLLGYPFALLLMIVSAILPYLYFKRRGWL